MRNNKGIGLVEVVIALAVMAIVSLTAISLINSSIERKRYNQEYNETRIIARNIIECFKHSTDNTDFESLTNEYNLFHDTDEINTDTYSYSDETDLRLNITIENITQDNLRRKISLVCLNTDDTVIYTLQYQKG